MMAVLLFNFINTMLLQCNIEICVFVMGGAPGPGKSTLCYNKVFKGIH